MDAAERASDVIDAVAAKAAPTAPAAAARLDEELAAVTNPWHARYVGVVLDAASVSALHEAVPPRHPTVTDQKHLTLCFEPRRRSGCRSSARCAAGAGDGLWKSTSELGYPEA